jgi:hypothetical protein|tara:strand:- start:29363 stop:30826 length:1464 start_codon:yes stop_codon:yes gene_type:complete
MDDQNAAVVAELKALWERLGKRYAIEQPQMLSVALSNGSERLPKALPISKVLSDCTDILKSLIKQGEEGTLKYSALPLHAPALPKTFSIHELANILKDRELRTKNILKHGVAPYIYSNSTRISFMAEDSKGRLHEFFSLMGQSVSNKVNFMLKGDTDPLAFDDGKTAIANAVKVESASIYSPYGDKMKEKMLNVLNKGVVVTHGNYLFEHAKKAFFARPDDITMVKLDGHPFEKGKIPLPTGNNPSIVAQLNKIEPSLIPYIINATKKGPTYRTLQKNITEGLKASTPSEQASAIIAAVKKQSKGDIDMSHRAKDWTALLSKEWDTPTKANAINREIMHYKHGFDVNADDTPKPKKSRTNKKDSPTKKQTIVQEKGTVEPKSQVINPPASTSKVNIDAALSAFYQHRESSSPGRLSVQVLAAMSPDALIPMSADEIRDFTNSVESIQKQPIGAEDGIRWLAKTIEHKLPNVEKPQQEEHSNSYRRTR